MADVRELIEAAEALEAPRPDPRAGLYNVLRAALDKLEELGADPVVIADLLILAGHAVGPRYGWEIQQLAQVEGWTDPAPEVVPDPLARNYPESNGLLAVKYTRRLAEAMRDKPRGLRTEVFAFVVTDELTREQVEAGIWRGLQEWQPERPGAVDADVRVQERGRLVGRGAPAEEQHPTPREAVERPGAYGAALPRADESNLEREDRIRAAFERLTDASVTSEEAVARCVAELRELGVAVATAVDSAGEPPGWVSRSVAEVQRAFRELRLTGNTTIGIDHGTNPPSVFRANRSFSGRMGEVHWNPGALERLLGVEAAAPPAPLDGEDLARALADLGPPAEPRNRAERRAARRRRGGL